MFYLGIKIKNTEEKDFYLTEITTTPDNPYFNTDDAAMIKKVNDWRDIKDGDFLVVGDDVKEGFDDNIIKVSFNEDSITLSPLSSFVPYEEREVMYGEMNQITLKGKVVGIIRSLSNEVSLKKIRKYSENNRGNEDGKL